MKNFQTAPTIFFIFLAYNTTGFIWLSKISKIELDIKWELGQTIFEAR